MYHAWINGCIHAHVPTQQQQLDEPGPQVVSIETCVVGEPVRFFPVYTRFFTRSCKCVTGHWSNVTDFTHWNSKSVCDLQLTFYFSSMFSTKVELGWDFLPTIHIIYFILSYRLRLQTYLHATKYIYIYIHISTLNVS